MRGPKRGTWTVTSESTPRWNAEGETGPWFVTAGIPPEAQKHINDCKKKFGKEPSDLMYSFHKDW